MLSGELNADTLLRINMQSETILSGAKKGLEKLPEPARQAIMSEVEDQQKEFSGKITSAFIDSLHHVFMIGSVMMVLALALTLFVNEKPLRDKV